MIDHTINVDLCEKVELIRYLPMFYRKILHMQEIQNTLGLEVSKMNCIEENTFLQKFIESATWGLKLWEEELGLQVNPNLSYEHRREMIKAKLRGTGTTTLEVIKNVVQSFSKHYVDVIEDNPNYSFYIDIDMIADENINIKGLTETIEQIKPAHLGFGIRRNSRIRTNILSACMSGEITSIYPQEIKDIDINLPVKLAMSSNIDVEMTTIVPSQ